MPMTEDYVHFPSNATVGEVLRAYVDRNAQWWWRLTTEMVGWFLSCSQPSAPEPMGC